MYPVAVGRHTDMAAVRLACHTKLSLLSTTYGIASSCSVPLHKKAVEGKRKVFVLSSLLCRRVYLRRVFSAGISLTNP